ncbi:tetratricopeptide repeat protein [Actinomadura miaoliensis]|uniref:Tetratricopeptide repeat protein n=1 Tax=Actinomadura miaoliensis TaxID=430685 RepID=A0ABP7VZM1_9ACTN
MESAGGETESRSEEPAQTERPSRWKRLWKVVVGVAAVFAPLYGLLTATVGFTVDFPAVASKLPWVDPPPLNGAVNIVVPEIALDTEKKTERDEKVARKLTDALFAGVQEELGKAGRIEVGHAKNRDVSVYRTEDARTERLRKDLASRGGHIAISGTLVPGTVDRLRVEVYLDRNRLDEAYQLGGLQKLSVEEFGDVSLNPAAQGHAQDLLVRKARLYTQLIVAVGWYGTGGTQGLVRSLRSTQALLPKFTEPAEKAFGWLLIGNTEARLKRQDEAVRAYRKALAVDPGSIRAKLGLAEIDYLRAGGSFSEGMCTPAVSRLATLRRLERKYLNVRADLDDDRHDLRPRVEFALARTRLCILLVRGRGSIGEIEDGFRAAAAALEQDSRKTWLRMLTADSYAMLGATSLLRLRDRDPDPVTAARYYEAAAKTTPDERRRTIYDRRRKQLTSRH